jgi:hypothetical protein
MRATGVFVSDRRERTNGSEDERSESSGGSERADESLERVRG